MKKQKQRLENGLSAKRRVYADYRRKSKISFEITFDQFLELSQQDCYYCGTKPSNKRQARNGGKSIGPYFIYNGLDRTDNQKGYTLENCVPCCQQCNKAKRNMPFEEFIEWIKKAANHLNKKTA